MIKVRNWQPFVWLFLKLALLRSSTGAPVAAPRWRLVGRNAGTSWVVNNIGFYSDATCATAIQARPFRSHQGDGKRFDGSAFSAPNFKRPSAGTGGAAEAFEANAIAWDSGVACGSSGTTCHVGFRWLSDQVDVPGLTDGFATVGILQKGSAAPRCIKLDQSTQANRYATTVLVQYSLDGASGTWQDHTVFNGLNGGIEALRLPEVAVAR
eukprot:TRINITY_DN27078_c0_g1_i1.p1 TRINITY_DN27078_c0_g1~~TRINITY_DN27078_c0_g1_i1.p1  ORF type:complete len:210 (+),score=20.10 TRINITY_DN27078_c0_g1_i1:150-779(+)